MVSDTIEDHKGRQRYGATMFAALFWSRPAVHFVSFLGLQIFAAQINRHPQSRRRGGTPGSSMVCRNADRW